MTNPNHGRFAWHELMTNDAAKAVPFYQGLFGWTVKEMDMGPGGIYRLLSQGDRQVGGMMVHADMPSAWLVYVGAHDTDAAAAMVVELGGKLLVPPTTVPDMLRFAVAMDPHGAAFGILEGVGPNPEPPLPEGPAAPGTFCWDELHTTNQAASGEFYGKVFGWTGKVGEGEMKYWHWMHDGKDVGGMMDLMNPHAPPHWLPYVAVTDVDAMTAKVRELGGKVHMDPMEIEKVGKFSVVADPTGGTFALFRSARV